MRENPIAVRSKNSIEAALLALMGERPYRDITIGEITARAGLSRQTFYLHFADKEDVLSRYLLGVFDGVMRRVETERVASVSELVATYTTIVAENAAFFKILAENNLTGLVCRLYSERLVTLPPVLWRRRESRRAPEIRYCNAFWVAAFVETYALWLLADMQTERGELNRIIANIMLGNYFRADGDEINDIQGG